MRQVRAQRRKHHIIYKTTCLVTGKWYIGLHSTDNLDDGYQGSGTQLQRSIKKHGKNQHKTEILEHCPDRATLILREAEIVNDDLLAQEQCMNLMIGGNANREERKNATEEGRRKNSEASKAMWAKRKADPVAMAEHIKKIATPEIVAKRAKANTGKKRGQDQIDNLKKGQQNYYASADPKVLSERALKASATMAELGTRKGGRPSGIPLSEEQRQHLSIINKGKVWPRATCAGCGKQTTLSALNRYHTRCQTHASS